MEHDIHTPEVEQAESDRLRRVSELAFARFEARGGEHGHDIEDWLEAERQEAEAGPSDSVLAKSTLAASDASGAGDGEVQQRRDAKGRARDAGAPRGYAEERPVR